MAMVAFINYSFQPSDKLPNTIGYSSAPSQSDADESRFFPSTLDVARKSGLWDNFINIWLQTSSALSYTLRDKFTGVAENGRFFAIECSVGIYWGKFKSASMNNVVWSFYRECLVTELGKSMKQLVS